MWGSTGPPLNSKEEKQPAGDAVSEWEVKAFGIAKAVESLDEEKTESEQLGCYSFKRRTGS